MIIEGSEGTIRLYNNGKITIQKLGKKEEEHRYVHNNIDFAGDCVYFLQRHFIDCLLTGNEFETGGEDYLRSLAVQEAVYESAATNMIISVLK